MNNKPTVIIISGPTAVGKSTISYYLAKRIDGEIVNCDSVQLYEKLDIGSAKPSKEDMEAVPHHMYSIVSPSYPMTVKIYQEMALEEIDDIISRGKVPIVVGGTGLYLNSILFDMDFSKRDENKKIRRKFEALAEERGSDYLYEMLDAVDPKAAQRLHKNNKRKIIRALEAYELGGSISSLSSCKKNSNYNFKFFALNMDREWLYDRINRRVLKLVKEGLIEEVEKLLKEGVPIDNASMKAIGYKEIVKYLKDELTLKDAIYEIMKNTRHYAKRQITWLKRYDEAIWIEIKKGDAVGSIVDRILSEISNDKKQKQ